MAEGYERPSLTSAPSAQAGRFSRVLRGVLTAVLLYALFYAVLVLGSYGWFTTLSPTAASLPQGAGFAVSMSPLGAALHAPEASVNIGYGAEKEQPLLLKNVRHVWPLLTPWRMVTHAAEASLKIMHETSHDQFDGHDLTLTVSLPLRINARAVSIDWRSVAHSVKEEGKADPDPTTFVNADVTYSEGLFGIGGKPQAFSLTTAPIMLPPSAMGNAVQIDKFTVALSASRKLPHSTAREDVLQWHEAGGRVDMDEFNVQLLGMDMIMAGDAGLNSELGLDGNFQLQINGVTEGYARIGELNLVPPQHYRLLGFLLQGLPDGGNRVFSMPVRLQKNKLYVGPAAAFSLGVLPWQVTNTLLDTPVAPTAPPAGAPQMTPIPQNVPQEVQVAPVPKAAQ